MTDTELFALYSDAKGQVEFIPPTRICPRTKWRVRKWRRQPTLTNIEFNHAYWECATKAEVTKFLAEYGLTTEQFITAAIQKFWIPFGERCGEFKHEYLKKRFPYAFKAVSQLPNNLA